MTKQEIEYEDAPSGNVTFYGYKLPLMKYTEGFGFVGALVFDTATDKIQCHLCGEWFAYLPNHLHREHGMTASAYKDKVGLFQNTALISEGQRAVLIATGIERFKNLIPGKKQSEEVKLKISKTLKENAKKAEGQNLKGTCPEQLIDRMKKIAEKKGDKLRMNDFKSFRHNLKYVYGSVENACRIAGIQYHKPSIAYSYTGRGYTIQDAKDFIMEYKRVFNEIPHYTDFRRQGKTALYNSKIGTLKRLLELAGGVTTELKAYEKDGREISYSKEELLKFLKDFEKIHGRKPSYSDCNRCLIPGYKQYTRRFVTFKNALKEAFGN